MAVVAYAAAPPANTSIGNQASATYTDASNTHRTATSNTVVTIVQQVAGFILTTDGQSKPAVPGAQVVFSHTLINTGNGIDTFDLRAVNNGEGNFVLTNVTLYADADGSGVPDKRAPITSTGPLAPGASFKFVAVGIVPVTQMSLQMATIAISAAGTATEIPAPPQSNIDTAMVNSDPTINTAQASFVNHVPEIPIVSL